MQKIKISYILTFIVIIYAALFFIFPHTENLPADGGVKIRQVKDFIKKDYRSFSAVYNGEKIDPDKEFFPMKPPMANKIKNEIYYVFPFYLTLVYTPLYKFFGINGIIFLCMIMGILTILVSLRIARLIKISELNTKLMLIFMGFASIIPVYSFFLGEYTLAIFLVTLSVYLVLLGNEKKNSILYFLAGLSAGASVYFRIELGLYSVLLLLGVIIFKIYSEPKKQVPALLFSLVICAIFVTGINYYVTESIFGVKAIEFLAKSGELYPLSDRLLRLFHAFFFSDIGLGLFLAWPIYFFLFGLLIRKNWDEENVTALKLFLFIILIFFFSIPFLVNMKDGSILGPRYLAPFQAILILAIFKTLDFKNFKTRAKEITARICIVYSCIIMIIACVILYQFDHISDDVNKTISSHAKNNIVILYDHYVTYSVFPLFDDRIIFTLNNDKDWEIIRERTRKMGIKDFTVIDFANNKESILYPFKNAEYEVKDRFSYHGNYRRTIVENIRFNN